MAGGLAEFQRVENNVYCGLPKSGWVMDVGCLNWVASTAFANMGCKVISIDPNPTIPPPPHPEIRFENIALVPGDEEEVSYVSIGDGTGNYIETLGYDIKALVGAFPTVFAGEPTIFKVKCSNVTKLMAKHGVDIFEVVKFNCEGSEVPLLANWPGPVAKQLSFVTHEHLFLKKIDYEPIFKHLSTWYDLVKHDWVHNSWFETVLVLRNQAS